MQHLQNKIENIIHNNSLLKNIYTYFDEETGIETPKTQQNKFQPFEEGVLNTTKESKKLLEYFSSKTTILSKYPDFFTKEEELMLVYGSIQSGKSKLIQFKSIYNLLFKKITTIIVVRNLLNDSQQLYDGFLNIIEDLKDFDIDENDILINTKEKFNKVTIKKPKIIISLANSSQVKVLCSQIHKAFKKDKLPIEIIVDEADVLAYANKGEADMPYIRNFFEIKDKCMSSVYITATPYNSLFTELELKNTDMYILEPQLCYKDYSQVNYIPTDFNFKNIENIREFYRKFNEIEVQLIKNNTLIHPNIFLHTTANKINEQNIIFKSFQHEDFQDWDVIIYNGTDKKLYTCWREEIMEDISDYDRSLIKKVKSDEIVFKNSATIRDIIQVIKNLDNLRDRHNILILAGRLADRGTNFVSRDYDWHLTHQILDIKSSSDCVSVTQHVRILGNYRDTIPLSLYSSCKNIKIIKQSFETQEKILNQITEEKSEMKVRNMLCNLKLYEEDMPKIKLTKRVLYKNLLNVKVKYENDNEKIYSNGYVSFRNYKEEEIYKFIYKIFCENNYINWTSRGIFQTTYKERNWDIRILNKMQVNNHNNNSKIKWKKVNNKYFYKLV